VESLFLSNVFFFAVSTNARAHTKGVKCLCNVEPFNL